jgi:DNA-directed RNA polymerase specialized sigma24 family protein
VPDTEVEDLLRSEQARQRREDTVARWTLPDQIALTLRAVGGLTTAEIGRAFLVLEATMTRRPPAARGPRAPAGDGR